MTRSSTVAELHFRNPHLQNQGAYQRVQVEAGAPLPRGTDGEAVAAQQRIAELQIAGAGRMLDLAEFNRATSATSLLVVRDGALVHEWYADDVAADDLFLGASMSKSLLAHCVGASVLAGHLDLSAPVTDYVPELAGTGYERVSGWQVATMTSGVDWVEDHRDPASLASRLVQSLSGQGAARDVLTKIGPAATPGSRYEYCTADSVVLDWIRERATGEPFTTAVGRLWSDLGCEHDLVVAVDADSVAFAGGGIAATAADWARIGLLQVDGTCWWAGGERLLSGEWVDLSSRPGTPFLRPGRLPSSITTHAGFGAHWWPLDEAGQVVTADGSRGQFCLVDRQSRTVVVKTSQWAYADFLYDRQCRDLSYLGLADIARAASG